MKDLKEVQETLSEVFDYLKGNNLQIVGEELLTKVYDAHRIVEKLALYDVSKSVKIERRDLEKIITKELEANGEWYETFISVHRIIERRNFDRVSKKVADKILAVC